MNDEAAARGAYHEAGHAVIAIILGQKIKTATLDSAVPRGGVAPWVECIISFCGPAAEQKHRPLPNWRQTYTWGGDAAKAIKALPDLADRSAAMAAAEALVEKHWHQIEAVARELLARGALTGDEVDALL